MEARSRSRAVHREKTAGECRGLEKVYPRVPDGDYILRLTGMGRKRLLRLRPGVENWGPVRRVILTSKSRISVRSSGEKRKCHSREVQKLYDNTYVHVVSLK